MMQFKSPVQFPPNWVRNGSPILNPQFGQNIDLNQAIRYLQDEVRDVGGENATLYSNFENINNEQKRSKRGHSEGVGLRMNYNNAEIFIACDKWAIAAQNIYAISTTLRNVRLMAESGTISVEKMLNCFNPQEKRHVHLKENTIFAKSEWLLALGLGETATLSDANATYRARAKLVHQDEEALIALNQAIEQARQYLVD